VSDTYREINDLDQARAYIAVLEKENAQAQWKLIQMGKHVQYLGGRPKDAYKKPIGPQVLMCAVWTVVACGGGTFLLWAAVQLTNTMGCAG
jgi:hypothetical protein